MKTLLRFLTLLLPELKPLIDRSPELLSAVKRAFQKVGGNEEDLNKILEENQKDIDRLGDPDSFRKKK